MTAHVPRRPQARPRIRSRGAGAAALWAPRCAGAARWRQRRGAGRRLRTGAWRPMRSASSDASETAGPYPGDGSNSAPGNTSNILSESGVVRSDIRSSFGVSTNAAAGVPLTLKIKLGDAGNGCAALPGYAIYVWHCTQDGHYSLYTAPDENYLRGVQVADADGMVSFTTIFPGCYRRPLAAHSLRDLPEPRRRDRSPERRSDLAVRAAGGRLQARSMTMPPGYEAERRQPSRASASRATTSSATTATTRSR